MTGFRGLVILFLLLPALALGTTWRVERDGTGDFLAIQPAIEAASAGDTIQLGPGRYIEYQTWTPPGWTWPMDIYGYVTKENLTFIGADVETVIIGPEVQEFLNEGPKGIMIPQEISQIRFRDITFSNLYNGICFLDGTIYCSHCKVEDCYYGAFVNFGASGSYFEFCSFYETGPGGGGVKIL